MFPKHAAADHDNIDRDGEKFLRKIGRDILIRNRPVFTESCCFGGKRGAVDREAPSE